MLFFLRVRLKSKRISQRVGKRTLASPICSVDVTANSVFDVAQLVCRTGCDPDRMVFNMIWWHSKGYSWLVGLRVVRRVVTDVAIEVIQGCFRLCFIF